MTSGERSALRKLQDDLFKVTVERQHYAILLDEIQARTAPERIAVALRGTDADKVNAFVEMVDQIRAIVQRGDK